MLCGIDRLSGGKLTSTRRRLRSAGVAVLTHAAAVDRRGRHLLDVLSELGVEPTVLFSPEHGFDALAQAEEAVAPTGETDLASRTVSLYGNDRESLTPKPDHFDGVETLLIDLVDVGSRYYTYVWSALLAARAAEAAGVHTLVLDRPNPITGNAALLEGAPQSEGFCSFVGLEPLPTRHSMTIGEILVHFLHRDEKSLGPDGAISVVSTIGWERHRTASAWDRPFVMPSPNMPTVETALVYPGGCLIEGTNLSEGRGTTAPFQLVGAPFLKSADLAAAMIEAALPGAQIRSVSFKPTFDKHANETCNGVMIHVTDPDAFRPVMTYTTLVTLAAAQAKDDFQFRTEPYEFESKIPAFDLLTGSDKAREAIAGGASPNDVVEIVSPVPVEWRETVAEAEARLEAAAS